jgi:hypothetical protein
VGAAGGGLPGTWARGAAGRLHGRRRRRRARPVGAAGHVGTAGGRQPGAWGGRAAAGRVGTAGGRRAVRVEEKEVKGEKERREPVGRFSYLLCRVPAIRHSAKIFLKFKNKLCRVPDLGHSVKTSLPSASCTGTRQRSILQSLPSAHGKALGIAAFAEC